jgi:hypothetical protein
MKRELTTKLAKETRTHREIERGTRKAILAAIRRQGEGK